MNIRWLSPEDEEWRVHLSKVPHDIYHRPEYLRLEAELAAGMAVAVLAQDEHRSLFLPLVLRGISDSASLDATSPNGYPGPLLTAPAEDVPFVRARFAADAIKQILEQMRTRRIVSAFIRCHPFLTDDVAGMRLHGTLVEHGNTVYIDLEQSDEMLWRQTRASHRSEINQSRIKGYVTVIDEDWNFIDDFISMYYETMRRVSASEAYFFPPDYFAKLRDTLAEYTFLCVTLHDGVMASGGIFTRCNDIVQYHLGATADKFLHVHPSKQLLDFARRWSKQNGYRRMHLGGGVNCRKDSLLNFKLGFSKLSTSFATYRLIADERAYLQLVQSWESEHRSMADSSQGFFPAYRKPADAMRTPNISPARPIAA